MGSLILIVDRDDVERRYLSALLAADGFDVSQVERAVEGLVAVTASEPSLVILAAGRSLAADAKGVSLRDLVRVFQRLTSAPLAIIGDPESPDELAALDSGADVFLPRGCGAAELVSRSRMLIRRRDGHSPVTEDRDADAGQAHSVTFTTLAQAVASLLNERRTANGGQAA